MKRDGCAMENNPVLQNIVQIVNRELEITLPCEINSKDTLLDIGIDSIAFMALIVYLEEIYQMEITFDEEMFSNYLSFTIGDLLKYIERQQTAI